MNTIQVLPLTAIQQPDHDERITENTGVTSSYTQSKNQGICTPIPGHKIRNTEDAFMYLITYT